MPETLGVGRDSRGARLGGWQGLAALVVTLAVAFALASPSEAAFARRLVITVGGAQVSGGPHSNFPMLVSLTQANLRTVANSGQVTSDDGDDILFRAEDGTTCAGASPCVLDHEIEDYDPATGSLVAWVRVPSLNNGTTIYLYYGDAAITCSQQNETGVWDSSFREVFHLNENADHVDSTANAFTAVSHGAVVNQASGQIGKALDLQGGASGATEAELIVSDGTLPDATSLTLEAWAYMRSYTVGNYVGLMSKGREALHFDGSSETSTACPAEPCGDWVGLYNLPNHWATPTYQRFGLGWASGDGPNFCKVSNLEDLRAQAMAEIQTGQWYHVSATYDQATSIRRLYVNGAQVATDAPGIGACIDDPIPQYGRLGTDSNLVYHDGFLDEFRLSLTVRSAGWIQTGYNNQGAPGTFHPTVTDEGAAGVSGVCTATANPCEGGPGSCNLRSIGTVGAYSTGTVTATNGSDQVTGSGVAWLTANRGRGDNIDIAGVDYTVLAVDSESELRLTAPYGGATGGSKPYAISRKFNGTTALQTWADCVTGGGGCGGVTSDLTPAGDNRSEIGIVYDDGLAYDPAGAGNAIIAIDGATTDETHTITLTADPGNRHLGISGAGVVLDNTGNGSRAVVVQDQHVTLEWLEIRGGSGAGDHCLDYVPSNTANHSVFQNNIIRDCTGQSIRLAGAGPVFVADIINNVVFGGGREAIALTAPLGTGTGSRVRILNNTIYRNNSGGTKISTAENPNPYVTLRNNIIVDDTSSPDFHWNDGTSPCVYAPDCDWVNVASSHNISGDTAPATGAFMATVGHSPRAGGVYAAAEASLSFVDAASAGKDLHIQPGSVAQGAGVDLSAMFVSDIDAAVRTVPWDVGADEITVNDVYRSIGTTATNLNTSSRTVSITGGRATFSGPMPGSVGVGDVLQYQVTGTWHLAFIESRASDQVYTVQSSAGGPPRPAAAGTAVSVFRAYTSLSNWQAQTENPGIEDSVEDFDTSRDLVGDGRIMMAACYNDGPMNDSVNITGWTTGPNNYVRVFAPAGSHLVGTSQRHNGTAGTGFRMRPSLDNGGFAIVTLSIPYARVEGLELDGSNITNARYARGVRVLQGMTNVGDIRIDSMIIHDLHTTQAGYPWEGSMGIITFQDLAAAGPPLLITNNIVYDITNTVLEGHIAGIQVGSRANSFVYNNTVYNIQNDGNGAISGPAWGIYAKESGAGTVTVQITNNYVGLVDAPLDPGSNWHDYDSESSATLVMDYNVSSDATADNFGGTANVINQNAYGSYFVNEATRNLHLSNPSAVLWGQAGDDLSATFTHDVDLEVRPQGAGTWDIGADAPGATTAVDLVSFEAAPQDSAVALAWRTGSELSNLGFHLFRSLSENGPWTRISESLIPGLGSSPQGAYYSFTDTGLQNGTRYFYRLEDIDTASVSTFHGPVSAVPQPASERGEEEGEPGAPLPGTGPPPGEGPPGPTEPPSPGEGETPPAEPEPVCSSDGRCLYGAPGEPTLEILSRSAYEMTVELRTPGFIASPDPVGVFVSVPGFASPTDEGAVDLPLRRAVLDAVVGRRARLVAIEAIDELSFSGLRPAVVAAPAVDSRPDGTVRAVRGRVPLASSVSAVPRARIAGSAFMGQQKKLALELHPLRWDPAQGRLVLSKTLRVRIAFTGTAPRESGDGSFGRRNPRPRRSAPVVFAHFHTTQRGLHAVPFEAVFPRPRRPLPMEALRLVQGGRVVPVHVEPPTGLFGPGSVLYFHVDREAASTDFSSELSFALERTSGGVLMDRTSAAPLTGPLGSAPLGLARFETNRIYQSGLLQAPDPWLWDFAQSGMVKNVSLFLEGVDVSSPLPARVRVFLQGGSDAARTGEHHLSFSLNGVSLGETSFEGMVPHLFEGTLSAACLLEGTNTLTFTNVGDTGVVSRVFLDRVEIEYPQAPALRAGRFSGEWTEEGVAEVTLGASGADQAFVAPGAAVRDTLRHPEELRPVGGDEGSLRRLDGEILRATARDDGPQNDGGTGADRRGSPGLVTSLSTVSALDVTDPAAPLWLTGLEPGPGSVRMQVSPGRRYQVVAPDGLVVPRVSHPTDTGLRDTRNQSDYILVAPQAFLDAAQPLLLRRESQGLTTFAASLEDIASDFGGGTPSAEAIRDFLAFAYHSWQPPSPRYVLLLGDASFDPRNFTGFDQGAPLPALWAKTSYLVTASDPAIAAVNGEDLLPDLALGRLPATNLAQAHSLVQKVLDWEDAGYDLSGPVTLVADNPDQAGDFEADIADIQESFLAPRNPQSLLVRVLGSSTRPAILDAMNGGLSLLSYVGHGGSAVWASENVLNAFDPPALLAQPQQPLMLTMNCLNGYFVQPNLDSLAEAFLKAEGRGTIAAFSPSGLSLDGPAHVFHRALMNEIVNGNHERLGDAVLAAQQDYALSGHMPELLGIYGLFGDPAMRIQ